MEYWLLNGIVAYLEKTCSTFHFFTFKFAEFKANVHPLLAALCVFAGLRRRLRPSP